jgi:hypothetical protein
VGFPAEVLEVAERVRNWGRWGTDDELGTLNLIDDAARRRGVACVADGRAISLALPLSADGPQMGFIAGRINPQLHPFTFPLTDEPGEDRLWHDDRVDMGTQACTHWDGLAHASYNGTIYNGFPDTTIGEQGALRCGIQTCTRSCRAASCSTSRGCAVSSNSRPATPSPSTIWMRRWNSPESRSSPAT